MGAAEEPPQLVALPATAPHPADNPATADKIALGRRLFFDPRLSGDNSMSCATCHAPDKGWADGLARSPGHAGKLLARNSQSVLNTAWYERLFWDGRAGSLEEQALAPLESPDEMRQDLAALEEELAGDDGYVRQFQQVFATRPTRQGVARALAAFQRTLVARGSPLDRSLLGDEAALSPAARRGLDLFVGEAGCIRCHHGILLSDGKFHRLGVSHGDAGLAQVTGRREDRGKFRTPSLRNVAQTAPYMHDGSLATLTDVVEFYYRGAGQRDAEGLPLDIEPLSGRSFSEIADLTALLEAMTGPLPDVSAP